MTLNAPMILTLARPFLLVPVGVLLALGWNITAAVVFVLAALTDALDGYVARKTGQTSNAGAVADQIADKVFVACALLLVAWAGRLPGLWLVPAALLIARDFAVSGLREWAAAAKQPLPVAPMGKAKTAAQMGALTLLIALPGALWTGHALLAVATALSLASAVVYLRRSGA